MKTTRNGAYSAARRRTKAVESFNTAAECIGPVESGMSLFAITRGQFSMIDAVLHILSAAQPADLSLWTWTVAEYEVQCLDRLRRDGRLRSGLLVIDGAARKKNAAIIADWKSTFGPDSVRYCVNHAKIATVQSDNLKVLLRGSMNLNFNPRFEQMDITEGGEDFELVKRIEGELPVLPDDASNADTFKASKAGQAFDNETLSLFEGTKIWQK